MEPKSPSKHKLSITGLNQFKRGIKTGVSILVVLLILLGVFFAFKSSDDQYDGIVPFEGSYYTVVVDCGSTGTRVNVFEWVSKRENKRDLPILLRSYPDNNSTKSSLFCKYHCFQTEPGLDKFVRNSSGVSDSLEPLITWAERIVPFKRHGVTPIFVLATAGLRRLGAEDVNLVLNDIEAVLKRHSFSYRKSSVRVLSGREEAYYSWVGLNYKMGIFEEERSGSRPTLGVIDLGGSSLQVVVEVGTTRDETRLVDSKLGSVEHRVLAYSLPAFGMNGAFDRAVVMLSRTEALGESGDGALELRHPCFGYDFAQNYTCYGCFGLNVTEHKNVGGAKESELSLKLLGEPNWERCKALSVAVATNSSRLFGPWSNPGEDYKPRLCIDGGSGMLNLTHFSRQTLRFHALSGFFAVHDTLNLSPRANLTKIWEKSQALCTRSWADKISVSKIQFNDARRCFHVPYMASLIEDALCIGDKEIVFGPPDVSWTLGAALVEGEDLRLLGTANSEITTLPSAPKFILSPVFLFVLLSCLLSVVYRCQVKLPMLGKKGVVARESPLSCVNPKTKT